MGGINIPTYGCLGSHRTAQGHELRFVLWVTPIQPPSTQIAQNLRPESAPRRVRLPANWFTRLGGTERPNLRNGKFAGLGRHSSE
jgi:hypothetical protein